MGTWQERQDYRILKLKAASEFGLCNLSRHRISLPGRGEELRFSNKTIIVTTNHHLWGPAVCPSQCSDLTSFSASIPFTGEERAFLAQGTNTVNSEFKGLFGLF